MRHAISSLTLDVYARPLTPAKRAAQFEGCGVDPAREEALVVLWSGLLESN